MLDRKVYEDSQLIIHGGAIVVDSNGNDKRELEILLEKILKGYKWCLGNGGVLYVEQENSTEVINLLKESGCLREN